MIDIALIRSDPEAVLAALARRGIDPPIDRIVELDKKRRAIQTAMDEARRRQKLESARVRELSGDDKQKLLDEMKQLSEENKPRAAEEEATAEELRALLLEVPNLPHESVPDGGEENNEIVRHVGEPPAFDFEPKDHLDIGQALGVIDTERAAKVSGSRFAYLIGQAAVLEQALVRFTVDRLMTHGFVPVLPPVLVRRAAMEGTGFLPTDEQQIYRLADDELFLVGTSEVPLAGLHMDEFIDADRLPVRYCGISSCFRREAGTYGKDMRGIFRVHQFEKVEMFSFTAADRSWDEHDFMLGVEEELMQVLEIPYRVVNIAAGELGGSAAKKYDIEAWMPGQQAFREITSCSNCTDYQARRLNCRVRTDGGPALVHTLNGTAATSSRSLIAIMENHQQADGTVAIPDALRSYAGFEILGR